jgi:hypothetical protein
VLTDNTKALQKFVVQHKTQHKMSSGWLSGINARTASASCTGKITMPQVPTAPVQQQHAGTIWINQHVHMPLLVSF